MFGKINFYFWDCVFFAARSLVEPDEKLVDWGLHDYGAFIYATVKKKDGSQEKRFLPNDY